MNEIRSAVGASSYPGRGILIGKSADAKCAYLAYFIMGRSENSRNRVFVEDGAGLRTEAFDPAKLVDPSLIIYHPVRVHGECTVVTNGDQTDTVYDALVSGGSFHDALGTRTFEPDAPNYTPRISAMLTRKGGDFALEMSVLRCFDGQGGGALRSFFEYESIPAGLGLFIHTYAQDGDPLPSFGGEPELVALDMDFDAFSESVWRSLDADNKVSLWTRRIELSSGETETRIFNKHAE